MKTAAIYARVSTTSQAKDGTSLTTQLEICRDYAKEHNYSVVKEIVEDISGAVLTRAGLEQIRNLAEAGEIEAVICLDPDRLSRNLAHMLVLTQEFQRHNVALIFISMPKE